MAVSLERIERNFLVDVDVARTSSMDR